ncbi:hypothetical protein J2W28_000781 [Variovorax boronicumulans]|nr:hypothetical protein [Variovorax boronicumulans]MDQ0001653.1 hypothetical protein [Variovorax boronicumulans]
MAYLHKMFGAHQLRDLQVREPGIAFGQQAERNQFVGLDVVAVFLGEQVLVDPVAPTLGDDACCRSTAS